jgi:hypothetical protein
MALKNYSKFFYGWKVTVANNKLDIFDNDGIGFRTATITVGTYSATELALEIKKQLDAISILNFIVSFDRTTRKFTIAANSNFNLLPVSGVNTELSVLPLLGFVTDKTGSNGYVADNVSGYEYKPQSKLWNYVPTTNSRKSIDGIINKSASGKIEVIKFGDERFMSCEIVFITNLLQESGSVIRSDSAGVENYRQFIEWCCDKGAVEFMSDENKPSEFQILLLESTAIDSRGLDYDLKELYDRGLSEYFNSGNLSFKLIEV